MKKILFAALAAIMLLGASDAVAQSRRNFTRRYNLHRRVETFKGLGIHFGYVHSSNSVKDLYLNEKDSGKYPRNGFDVGMTMDFMLIPESLYLQTGLDYVYQMNKPETPEVGFVNLVAKNQDHYLDIPLHLKYTHPITSEIGVFAQVGPTLSFGLNSKMTYRARLENGSNAKVEYNYYSGKITASGLSETIEDFVSKQVPESRFSRFDLRLGGAVGARFFDVLEASIGYDWGTFNKFRGETADVMEMCRRQLYVTVGVRF